MTILVPMKVEQDEDGWRSLMPPLPVLSGSRVTRALEKAGFEVVRIRGRHHVLRHPDGRGTSVPGKR